MRHLTTAVIASLVGATCLGIALHAQGRGGPSVTESLTQAGGWAASHVSPLGKVRVPDLRRLFGRRQTTAQSPTDGTLTPAPTVQTDKADYMPGETVTVTGSGWQPGEAITLLFHEQPLQPDHGDLTFVGGADQTGNMFPFTQFATDYHDAGVTFILTATGQSSGLTAVATFTDSAANLDQCTNGGVGQTPEPCVISSNPHFTNWVNGDANGQKAHWREGEFISYRDTIAVDNAGPHVFVIHYDTVHSSKNAIDYLGSFDATETTSLASTQFHANQNNPCADKLPSANCNPASPADSFAIPIPTLTVCDGAAAKPSGPPVLSSSPGAFKIWGTNAPDITNVQYVAQNVNQGQGDCSTAVSITFSTSGAGTVVLAWGGHIASQADWGQGNSATSIHGSPYHMAQDGLSSNGVPQNTGSTDRALNAGAVFFTPTISTLIKDSSGNTVTSVPRGTTVHDTAILSNASSDAGGSVTYNRFDNGTCAGTPATTQTVSVTNAVVPDSATFTPTTAGSFSYQAVYSGDSQTNNLGPTTGACEPLTVVTITPTVITEVHKADETAVPLNGSVPLDTTVHDKATVSGSVGTPTGTVDFTFFPNDSCSGSGTSAGSAIALSSGVAHPSSSEGPLAAGNYSFQAHYTPASGSPYVSADSGCEPFTVDKATLTFDDDGARQQPWHGGQRGARGVGVGVARQRDAGGRGGRHYPDGGGDVHVQRRGAGGKWGHRGDLLRDVGGHGGVGGGARGV
jgi:hypothetical protein